MALQPQICFGKSIDEESNGIFFDFPFRVMVLRSYSLQCASSVLFVGCAGISGLVHHRHPMMSPNGQELQGVALSSYCILVCI
jgi:hypothetical protein